MIHKRLSFACIILLITIVVSGCSINHKKETNNDADNSISQNDDSKIKLLFLYYNVDNSTYEIKDNDDQMIEKIEESLSQRGFYIDLIPYYMFSKNATPRKSYIDTINESLASGSIDAFHYPSYYEKYYGSEGINSISKDTLDIKDTLKKKSPVLYKKLIDMGAINESDKEVTSIAVYGKDIFSENDRVRVVLPADSSKKYDIDKMETFEDYIEFLGKVKSTSNLTPGYIAPYYNLMIALQDLNYYCIDNLLSSMYYEMPMFAFSTDDTEMKNPIPFEKIPKMKEKLMQINSLYKEGLLAYRKDSGDTEAFFRNKLNTKALQTLEIEGKSTDVFNSLASFCGGWQDSNFLPLLQGSKVFILNSKMPTMKEEAISCDKIYLAKYTKNVANIIKLMENLYLDRNIYDLVRYGKLGEDYNIKNGRVEVLLDKEAANNVDTFKKTHYYRNLDNFKFLLNSQFERYNSNVPINYEQESSKTQKAQSQKLPFESLIKENRNSNLQNVSVEIRKNINGETILKSSGNKCTVNDLAALRFGEVCKLLDNIWAPDFEKLYDQFVSSQNPKDIQAIKEYYKELIDKFERE